MTRTKVFFGASLGYCVPLLKLEADATSILINILSIVITIPTNYAYFLYIPFFLFYQCNLNLNVNVNMT